MLQLRPVCTLSSHSQYPRLCSNRSIFAQEFLGCCLRSRSRASRVRVSLSSNRKPPLQCRQTEHYDQEQRFGALENSSYSSAGAGEPLPCAFAPCCSVLLPEGVLRSSMSEFVEQDGCFCWGWVGCWRERWGFGFNLSFGTISRIILHFPFIWMLAYSLNLLARLSLGPSICSFVLLVEA